jgi:hypothetical protein
MSSIAAFTARRAFARPFARQSFAARPPLRRFATKAEEATLDKGPKRDSELYVRLLAWRRSYLVFEY